MPPELAQIGKPGPEEAARLITQFRTSGIAGDYYLEFELRDLPRRRAETPVLRGRWWGSRNDRGALGRIEITDASGAVHRLVLQNGDGAAAWRAAGAGPARLDAGALLAPLVPGAEVTTFDVLMPFLFWPAPRIDRIVRKLGRPTYEFVFAPPPGYVAAGVDLGAVRAYFDTKFNAPLEIETLGAAGRVVRTFAVLSLQAVGRQTLPKAIDYRNEVTRDKTRLQLTAAALDLALPTAIFDPATLMQPAGAPEAGRLVRIEP
ncbi:MAG: hypothetical protein JNL39_01730 [Opitutaceae bacterium]|nr:hypothetical protein [Opitutaceae bacterium]